MTEEAADKTAPLDAQKLWSSYEDIAMHFNDLLMRLRSQSLAGIAAVSTLVALFTKEGLVSVKMSWFAATAIFIAMGSFWVAIWFLDFCYYNRLLIGAVSAIRRLEDRIGKGHVEHIDMSTTIEAEFREPLFGRGKNSFVGVLSFYAIVLAVIAAGAVFSFCRYRHSTT